MIVKKMMTILVLVIGLGLAGCAGKKKSGDTDPALESANSPDSISTEATAGNDFRVEGTSDNGGAGGLQTVYFPYDSAQITGETRATLDANVAILQSNATVEVQIQGHCDERGGIEYNIALGEKRAKSIKEYLVTMGINSKRITTVSFGKENPVAFGHDEDSWTKNRRANFLISSK